MGWQGVAHPLSQGHVKIDTALIIDNLSSPDQLIRSLTNCAQGRQKHFAVIPIDADFPLA